MNCDFNDADNTAGECGGRVSEDKRGMILCRDHRAQLRTDGFYNSPATSANCARCDQPHGLGHREASAYCLDCIADLYPSQYEAAARERGAVEITV